MKQVATKRFSLGALDAINIKKFFLLLQIRKLTLFFVIIVPILGGLFLFGVEILEFDFLRYFLFGILIYYFYLSFQFLFAKKFVKGVSSDFLLSREYIFFENRFIEKLYENSESKKPESEAEVEWDKIKKVKKVKDYFLFYLNKGRFVKPFVVRDVFKDGERKIFLEILKSQNLLLENYD